MKGSGIWTIDALYGGPVLSARGKGSWYFGTGRQVVLSDA